MKLSEIMVRDVVTVSPEETSAVAAKRMRDKRVGCLVLALDGAVKGIVTDRDLLQCLSEGHDPHQCRVSLHASKPVIVERPDEELGVAASVMEKHHIKRLPILERGKLAGLISFSDIARLTYEQGEHFESAWRSIAGLIKAQALHQRRPKNGNAPGTVSRPHEV